MSDTEIIALKKLQPPTPLDHCLNYLSLRKSYKTTQEQYCIFAGISRVTLIKYLSQYKEEALKCLESKEEKHEPS